MRATAPFKVVLSYDPAIDASSDAYSEYLRTRDVSSLQFKTDAQPAIFWCRPLTVSECQEVLNKPTDPDRYHAAFVRGLVKVERLPHDDGSVRDWIRPDDASGKSKLIPDKLLDQYFDTCMIQEIGMVIMMRSFLARTKGHCYPLPATSLYALTAQAPLPAARMTDSAKSVPSSEGPQAQPEQLPQS